MSIATVVTGGFGSFGSIGEIVTFGYGIGEAAEARRGGAGAFTDAEILAHKLRQRRFLANLPASKRSDDETALLLTLARQLRQLQTLPPVESEPEIEEALEEAIEAALEAPERPKIDMAMSAPFLEQEASSASPSIADEITELKHTIDRMLKAREDDEEDDLETLLLLIH